MFKITVPIATLVFCGTSLAASPQQGHTPLPGYRYEIMSSPAGVQTQAFGISEAGVVAGNSRHPSGELTATIWAGTVPRRLGLFGSNVTVARDVDSTGMVIGFAGQGELGFRSFRWRSGVYEILTAVGTDQTTVAAVSEPGEIVGAVRVRGWYRAAHWNGSSQGALIPLPTTTTSFANGVNDSGTVVGLLYSPEGNERGFIHTNGATTIIAPLLGHNHTNLYDVNNSGVAVGHSTEVPAAGQGSTNAILVSNGTTRVIPMPSIGTEHVALKINDHGQILGQTGQRPFLYQNGELLLLSDLPGVPQLQPAYATDINERGQIAGRGHDGTIMQGFLLTPCLGNLNRDAVIDSEDLDLFYRAFHNGEALADVDGNGIVDSNDELLFLQAWTSGC